MLSNTEAGLNVEWFNRRRIWERFVRKGSDVNDPPAGTEGMDGYMEISETTSEAVRARLVTETDMRRFALLRHEDETGISGDGIVAEGVEFSNGVCVVNWLTKYKSQGVYPNVKEVENIHGHGGKTTVEWID